MDFWITTLILAFLISAIFAGILIPQILLIAFRKQLFDTPDERKIHQGIVPRLGGIAFKPVIIFTLSLLLGINLLLGYTQYADLVNFSGLELSFGLCALVIIYLVGVADDLIGVRYRAKFFVQILCGAFIVCTGLCFNNLGGVLLVGDIPYWLGCLITIFMAVFIINSINLIDGIDGLASGLSGVALFYYGIYLHMLGEHLHAVVAFATLGTVVPFFIHNVFGDATKGRKIFMGDTGALTIGLLLCILSIKICLHTPSGVEQQPAEMVKAFAPLLVPCFDVVRVFIGRVKRGQNPFTPDRTHIHHKLLNLGISHHVAMISILLFSGAFTGINVLLSSSVNINLLLLLDVIIWLVINYWLSMKIKKRNGSDSII